MVIRVQHKAIFSSGRYANAVVGETLRGVKVEHKYQSSTIE